MLKMGIPLGGVRQALQKEGKDPNVVELDPEKPYLSQVEGKDVADKTEPLLKDHPEFGKFFKVSCEYSFSIFCIQYTHAHTYEIRISVDAKNGYAAWRSAKCAQEGRKRYQHHQLRPRKISLSPSSTEGGGKTESFNIQGGQCC
jgi:hypothetical protein